jgi:hypothetical protein
LIGGGVVAGGVDVAVFAAPALALLRLSEGAEVVTLAAAVALA